MGVTTHFKRQDDGHLIDLLVICRLHASVICATITVLLFAGRSSSDGSYIIFRRENTCDPYMSVRKYKWTCKKFGKNSTLA